MTEPSAPRAAYAVGPNGYRITLTDLPQPGANRWVSRRKAEIVSAVRDGLLTLEEALKRYDLSLEEFESWRTAIARHGVPGLRSTRIGIYRATE